MTSVSPADFPVSAKELSELVSAFSEDPQVLEKVGGIKGLIPKLRTDAKIGLPMESADLIGRRVFFGKNYVEDKTPPTFLELCLGALSDFTLIMLMCSAVLSIVLGMTLEVRSLYAY
jgi:hypothetical protein